MDTSQIILSGFGGQGILMMGYVLATAGMYEDKHVAFLPSYGAEMRGGTAHCTVTLSNESIASPVASFLDFGVLMNTPSLVRFEERIKRGGTLFLNSDLVEPTPRRTDINVVAIPANTMAEKLGSARSANMVMVGAFARQTGLVSLKSVIKSVMDVFDTKGAVVREVNARAVNEGAACIVKEEGISCNDH